MELIETIVGFVIIFGCGLGVYLFGVWVGKQTKPVGFWANGKPFDPSSVTDVPGYIREYGALLRKFAVPCLLSAIVLPFDVFVSVVILAVWGTFGIWWLIRSYKVIEKKYLFNNYLTNINLFVRITTAS